MKPRRAGDTRHDADDVLLVAEGMHRAARELGAVLGWLHRDEERHPTFAKVAEAERWLSREAWRRLVKVPAASARGMAAKARALDFDAADDCPAEAAKDLRASLIRDLERGARVEQERQEEEREAWVAAKEAERATRVA
jgi:hypothetical protein